MKKCRSLWVLLAMLAVLSGTNKVVAMPMTGHWMKEGHDYTFGVYKLSDKLDRLKIFDVQNDGRHWNLYHFGQESDRVCARYAGEIRCSVASSDYGFFLKDNTNPFLKWFLNPHRHLFSQGYPCDVNSLFWGCDRHFGWDKHEWRHHHWQSHHKKHRRCASTEVPEPGSLSLMALGLLMGATVQIKSRRRR